MLQFMTDNYQLIIYCYWLTTLAPPTILMQQGRGHQNKHEMAESRHDFEMILLGDAGVGKTTLFIYFQTGQSVDDDARLTLGADLTYKSMKIGDQDVVVSYSIM